MKILHVIGSGIDEETTV